VPSAVTENLSPSKRIMGRATAVALASICIGFEIVKLKFPIREFTDCDIFMVIILS
jgi:hypothetical protein